MPNTTESPDELTPADRPHHFHERMRVVREFIRGNLVRHEVAIYCEPDCGHAASEAIQEQLPPWQTE